ncbi:MAG: FtsX-like permease family protein [Thermoanaerobaculia bacterium]
MYRSLIHFWRMNLAVALGAAVAAAVLTGALVVGDSVRGSLRDLTLERLGGVDLALTGQRFFRQELAAELAGRVDGDDIGAIEPAILLQGSAVHADTRARASGVGIQGVGEGFLGLFDDGDEAARLWSEAEGSVYPPAVIDEPLRAALGAEPGDDLLISLKRWSAVPRGSLLGRKDTGSVVETVRLRIAGVIPDRGLGSFSLAVHQTSSYNVFVPLAALQKALGQQGTVNSLMVARSPVSTGEGGKNGAALAAVLDQELQKILQPEDLGIRVEARDGYLSIESQEFILKPALIRAVETVAADAGAATLPILTYLVNRFELGDRVVPYSTVTALDVGAIEAGLRGDLGGELVLADGSPATTLGEDEILLNQWTADELAAAVGDRVDLTYFVVGDREDLREETASFRVAGIVPIAGLAADDTLSQEYPGIAGSGNMADWDPPFPIELGRVRPADEEYWDLYRDTPKGFIALDTGRRLWRNRWGELTAIRVASPLDAETFRRGLVEKMPLDASGLGFQPVKELGLAASGGATDFAGLFFFFSIFIIAAAAMLVALLFSLGVERRASEVGLLRAVGFPGKRVRGRLLAEGGLLAAAGALAGLAGAVGYAALMIAGLRTWWLPAVGTSRLALHVQPATLVLGWVASVLVVLLAIWLRLRRLRRVPTPALLANVSEVVDTRSGRRVRWTAVIALSLAAILIAVAFATGRTTDPALFGSAGPALLIGLLALFALRLGGSGGGGLDTPGKAALLRMAASSGARSRGRSILATTLVASASFLVVTVAAFQTDFSRMELDRESGTGGFTLIGESDVPLLYDPGDPDGRFELGFGSREEKLLAGTEIVPLRLLPGDDTSCLNLYKPTRPRILGAPPALIERGGFSFQKTLEDADNPWTLLDLDLGPGVIPAFGDANSMQWILKLGLGDDLVMDDEAGEEIRLRLVGILGSGMEPSIFQSELLISEAAFVRHFPDRSGWSYFLAETPADTGADGEQQIRQALESALEDYGFDAVGAADKLEAFHSVQNTYLSTFRTLGGLGLLLGTVGLAIVLLRNTTERRGELATLRAFGYRRSTLTWMVVVENALLLLAGLAIGTAAALLTAAPNLLGTASSFPGRAIAGTLAGIFLFGLLACTLAALGALRIPLLPALKAEH